VQAVTSVPGTLTALRLLCMGMNIRSSMIQFDYLLLITWTAEYEGRSRRETPLRRAMFA
jgi:hypothetical protein